MKEAMKIHPEIVARYPKLVKGIKAAAKKVGLDKLDCTSHYTLKKLGAKTKSPHGYPNKYTVCKGLVTIVGDGGDNVWLAMESLQSWFKTSPVVSCKITDEGYKIETANSFYMLED